jgi:translation initiation factor IF-2
MSNIFKRKKTTNTKPPAPKTSEAKKKTKDVSSETKEQSKKTTTIRKKAEKVVDVATPENEEQVAKQDTPVVVKRAKKEEPVEETKTPTVATAEETPAAAEEAKPIEETKTPTEEPSVVAKVDVEVSKVEDKTTVETTPVKEAPAPVVQKKATVDIPVRKSVLGKAVIAPPPNYHSKPAPEQTIVKPVAQEMIGELPSDKEERRKKKVEKTERFDREERLDKLDKKTGKKRTRTKLSTPKMEIKIEEVSYPVRKPKKKKGVKKKASPKPRAEKRKVFMEEKITVSAFAHQMSVKAGEVIKKLLSFEIMCSAEDDIDFDTATMVAEYFEYEVVNEVQREEDFMMEEVEKEGEPRPAVVTIMGHVDHGKTTLLDSIRKTNVAKGEAGGITQHLSAYQVSKNGQLITFIDTPGHKAFTAMRSRGAQVTDIVILVVAADDGVMPQTEEALSHARAAGVDIIVAINKCDKPNANPDRVKQELIARDLVPEEYGGDCVFVEIAALKGQGIDELLENIILVAEMNELRAPIDTHAQGTVLEASLDKGRGPVATVIVKSGTLKRGDSLVLGTVCGRVRAMSDHTGKMLNQALPSTPVEIIGLEAVPAAGDDFTVVKNDKDARALVSLRVEKQKQQEVSKPKKLTLEQLLMHKEQGELLTLNLILKTDVGGTLEAIKGTLEKINIEGTEIKILHSAVGAITEGDITLAHTYGGIVIGFNVRPDNQARKAVGRFNVDIKTYTLIHELENSIRKALKGMLSPETEEKVQALVEVREIYHIKAGTIAGCMVIDGKLTRKNPVRLLRNGIVVWEGKLSSLRRHKDDVREVEKGFDCGLMLDGFGDIKPLDQIESYALEEVEAD